MILKSNLTNIGNLIKSYDNLLVFTYPKNSYSNFWEAQVRRYLQFRPYVDIAIVYVDLNDDKKKVYPQISIYQNGIKSFDAYGYIDVNDLIPFITQKCHLMKRFLK